MPGEFVKEDCFEAHFVSEIVETEIEIENPDGSFTTETIEEVVETKID